VHDLVIHSLLHVDDVSLQALLWSYNDCHGDGEVVGAVMGNHSVIKSASMLWSTILLAHDGELPCYLIV
jgi:hypothetical protein